MQHAIEAGEYKNELPYPERPREPYLLKKVVKTLTDDEIFSLPQVRAKFEEDKAAYEEARRVYRAEEERLLAKFKADALEEVGLKDHPKADIAWAKAWEHGHSSGFSEIYYWLDEFAEVIL